MYCDMQDKIYPYAQFKYAPPDNGCTPDNYHCEKGELVKNKDALLSLNGDYNESYDYEYCRNFNHCN